MHALMMHVCIDELLVPKMAASTFGNAGLRQSTGVTVIKFMNILATFIDELLVQKKWVGKTVNAQSLCMIYTYIHTYSYIHI